MVLTAERPQTEFKGRTRLAQLPREMQELFFKAWNYWPTEAQSTIIDDDHLSLLVSGGYRSGKSRTGAVKAALNTLAFLGQYPREAGGRVAWLVGADYERCRGEFEYLIEMLSALPQFTGKVTKRIDPGEISIPTITGRPFTIKTKSASDPTSINMEAPIWILGCEAAHFSQDIYARLQSRMTETRAKFPGYGMLLLEGTAEISLGWYVQLWETWKAETYQEIYNCISFSMPSSSNTAIFKDGEDSEALRMARDQSTPEEYSVRHLGVPMPPRDRVHTLFDVTVNVQKLRYNPELPVRIGVDPGYSGQPSFYAVEVAQPQPNGQWWVIDEIRARHKNPVDICQEVTRRPWWQNKDIRGHIDVAGTQHAGAMESNTEVWFKELHLMLSSRKVKVQESISRIDNMLKMDPYSKQPRLLIDPRCELLISEFGGCKDPFDGQTRVYSWHQDKDGNVSGKTPKDQFNDAIKALAYMLVGEIGFVDKHDDRKTIRVIRRNRR